MSRIPAMVDDGWVLLAWAARQAVQVLPAVSMELLSAADDLVALEQCPKREAFYSALQQLIALVQVGPAEIQGDRQRQARLAPLVDETQRLLSYAVANGKQIEDPVRKDLVETANALTRVAISRLPARSVFSKPISSSPEHSRR